MASTYSQYKIELIGTGEQAGTWGTTTNSNFGSATPGTYQGFEQAIGGKATIDLSAGGTIALTLTNSNAAQNARALFFDLSGSPSGAVTLQVPAIQKSYIVKNGSGQTVTVEISGGTGVAVPNGSTTVVYADGTNVVTGLNYAPALTLGAALPIASGGTGSTSTTFVDLTTNVTGTLPVANGGTGITSFGTGVATALRAERNGLWRYCSCNITYFCNPGSWDTDLGHTFWLVRLTEPTPLALKTRRSTPSLRLKLPISRFW
jgi:hypothetical protein